MPMPRGRRHAMSALTRLGARKASEMVMLTCRALQLMSTFLVPPDQIDNFLAGFRKQFAIMRKQPGLISAQLHRGIAGSSLFMNYIVWESVDAFKRGYELPEFQAQLKQYPAGTVVSASFFQRVAVAGMCVGEGSIAAE